MFFSSLDKHGGAGWSSLKLKTLLEKHKTTKEMFGINNENSK